MDSYEKLRQAYLQLKTGDRLGARELLLEVIEQHPGEAEAWVGLSFCVDSLSERRRCLERALWADPEHRYARAALARLENEAAQLKPTVPEAAVTAPVAHPASRGWNMNQINLALGVIAAVLAGAVLIAALVVNLPANPGGQVAAVDGGQYQFIEFYADW
jgi:ferric-dicitrate binding protein FerR (iron transport regulator)